MCELIGHFVNYRKQYSPSLKNLLPATDFRLFAVCARFPDQLAQQVPLTRLQDGVYEVGVLTLPIRIIVVARLPEVEHNAMLHLFSAQMKLLRYGREHYQPHSQETSTLLYELFQAYSEDPTMSDNSKNSSVKAMRNSSRACPRKNVWRGWLRKNASKGWLRKNASKACPRMRLSRPFPPKPWRR